jgi:hypothetical protein
LNLILEDRSHIRLATAATTTTTTTTKIIIIIIIRNSVTAVITGMQYYASLNKSLSTRLLLLVAGNQNREVGVVSRGIVFILRFLKIIAFVQKVVEHTPAHTQCAPPPKKKVG